MATYHNNLPIHEAASFDRATAGPQAAVASVRNRTARIDMLAIGIALTLAALIRFNVLPTIGW